MANEQMTDDQSPVPGLQSYLLRRLARFLGRIDVAAIFIFVVLLLAALGSCFPQLSPLVAADPERLAQWEARVRSRYGRLADVLAAVGAFHHFRSPVFLVPLALLAVTTLVCTANRWRGVWRRAFHQPVRCSEAALYGAPYSATLSALSLRAPSPSRGEAGGGIDLPGLTRGSLERRGFRVRSETSRGVTHLRGDRNRLASLATLVTHLAVLLLVAGAALSRRYGWREEITVGPGEMAEVGHGSGLALRNEGFTVEHHPDGSVANYEAQVAVVEREDSTHGSVRVNEPLPYGLVGLYLKAYTDTPEGPGVTLLAVRDPGYVPVIVAGLLLLVGMTVSFNFPYCSIYARVEPEGSLRLAGRADRRACDFGREFASWVEEIRRAVGDRGEGTG
jgi:cytochrome c biogenesis protein ResB